MHFPAWMIATDGLKVAWRLREAAPSMLGFPVLLMALGSYIERRWGGDGTSWSAEEIGIDLLAFALWWLALVLLSFDWQCRLLRTVGGREAEKDKGRLRQYFAQAARVAGQWIVLVFLPLTTMNYVQDHWTTDNTLIQIIGALCLIGWLLFVISHFYRAMLRLPRVILKNVEPKYPYGQDISFWRSLNMAWACHFTAILGGIALFPVAIIGMILAVFAGVAGLALLDGVLMALMSLIYLTIGTAHFSALFLGRDLMDVVTPSSEGSGE